MRYAIQSFEICIENILGGKQLMHSRSSELSSTAQALYLRFGGGL